MNHAILGTNLDEVEVEPRSKAPGSGREDFYNTSVTFEPGVYQRVVEAAAAKDVSATVLVDAVIIKYFNKQKTRKGAKNVESDNSSGNESKGRGR